jgi:hypothetical protein
VNALFPGKSCPTGSTCLKQSQWYYQCLPTEGYTCIPTDGKMSGGGAQYTLSMWDQCGGMGGNCKNYQCVDGAYANYACPSGECLLPRSRVHRLCRSTRLNLPAWRASAALAACAEARLSPCTRAGSGCQRQNQWYFQCLPGNGGGWVGNGMGSTLNLWDQCGGKGGNCAQYTCADSLYPGQTCPAGSTCQRLHEWYSQCRPAGSSYGTCQQVGGRWRRTHRCCAAQGTQAPLRLAASGAWLAS